MRTRSGTMKRKTISGSGDSVGRLPKKAKTTSGRNEKKEEIWAEVMDAAEFFKQMRKNKYSAPIFYPEGGSSCVAHGRRSSSKLNVDRGASGSFSRPNQGLSRSTGRRGKCVDDEFLKHKARASVPKIIKKSSRLKDEARSTTKKTTSSFSRRSLSRKGAGSDSEDTDSDESGVEIITEAEFRNRKVSYRVKNVENGGYKSGPSVKKAKCTRRYHSSGDDADDDDDSRYSDESNSSAETDIDDEYTDIEVEGFKQMSESEFRKDKSSLGMKSISTCSSNAGGGHEIISDVAVARRTRSSTTIVELDLPDGPSSSSSSAAEEKKEEEDPHLHDEVSAEDSEEDRHKTLSEIFLKKKKKTREEETRIVPPDEASSDTHGHTEVADENNHHHHQPAINEQVSPETLPTNNEHVFPEFDLCRMIADSVLGRGSMLETKIIEEEAKECKQEAPKDPQTQVVALPLKFQFDDEVPKPIAKTEQEKEIEAYFDELVFCWEAQSVGSFNYPEEIKNAFASQETQYARCTSGNHELSRIDDQGLVCIYCHHVELGPKDVMPEWAEKTCREKKRLFQSEQPLEFDELHLKSLTENHDDPRNVASGTVWSIKPEIRESMYEHQQEGFEFLWKNLAGSTNLSDLKTTPPGEIGGCIISHAPGTGKTRLTIVFIETYMKLFPNCCPVIIAPAGMLMPWEEEFRKWKVEFPFINLSTEEIFDKEKKIALGHLAGPKCRDKNTIRMVNLHTWSQERAVLGISYSLFEKLTGENKISKKPNAAGVTKQPIVDNRAKDLRTILLEKPGLVVLDEGHYPRNQKSNIWNVLLKLRTQKRVILSGTPFQNNFSELFNTLRLVRPAIADALVQEKMISSRKKHKTENSRFQEVDNRAVERLKISMAPFVHVHKGRILQESLPGLRDCIVVLNPPPLQKSLIEKLEGTLSSTFELEHKAALLSVHPHLFLHSDSKEKERIGIDLAAVKVSRLNPNEGAKTKFILEFVRLSMLTNEKVLVFSQYIQPLKLINEHLKEAFKWTEGKHILQLQGKLEQRHRQNLINQFNDPQNESKIMLASTRCCSEGISLVGASRVILLDVVWNPSVETQAISRAYRIGQTKFVYTYHLMTAGTSEADKYCRQAEKERMSEMVFTSSSNECCKDKGSVIEEDKILGVMIDQANLKEMFDKVINHPKDRNLIETFGLVP